MVMVKGPSLQTRDWLKRLTAHHTILQILSTNIRHMNHFNEGRGYLT